MQSCNLLVFNRKQKLRCLAVCVSRGEIIDIIKEQGLKTIEEVGDTTGAGTGCGGCLPDIEKILNEINGQ